MKHNQHVYAEAVYLDFEPVYRVVAFQDRARRGAVALGEGAASGQR